MFLKVAFLLERPRRNFNDPCDDLCLGQATRRPQSSFGTEVKPHLEKSLTAQKVIFTTFFSVLLQLQSQSKAPQQNKDLIMAQGTIKAKKLSASTKGRKPTGVAPKKGARTIAPKRAVLVKNAKMTKVCFHKRHHISH